jgi:serine palmitoyltransferase
MSIHKQLEELVAEFLGHEDAIVCNMGFATNSCTIPALMGKGDLIISDELNHSSIVFGSRLSEANIRVFKHNDMEDLEAVIRESISQGHPRTHRPWKKIMIIVEGLYSMEGNVCNLPRLVELKNKYKCYLFMDEAHSIGALGPRGRGVCDLLQVNPKDVDILMGTFTKSFGASGGYISASKQVIQHLRRTSHSIFYCEPMAPLVCQQIITALNIIMGRGKDPLEGIRRITAIRENSIFFYKALKKMGFIVWGECGSPIIPLLLFHPNKIAGFSREALKRGLACVVVGYPATAIYASRVRFCISASHTREQLEEALAKISVVGDLLDLKQSRYKSIFEAMYS